MALWVGAVALCLLSSTEGRVFLVNSDYDDSFPDYCQNATSKCSLRSAYSRATGGDTIQLGVDPIMSKGPLNRPPGLAAQTPTSGILSLTPAPGRDTASITLRPSNYPKEGNFLRVDGWPWGGADGSGLAIGLRLDGVTFANFHYEGEVASVFSISASVGPTGRGYPFPMLDVDKCVFRNNSVVATKFVAGGVLGVTCMAPGCPYNTTICGVRVTGSLFEGNTISSPGLLVEGSGGVGIYLKGKTPLEVKDTEFVNLTMSVSSGNRNAAEGVAIWLEGCYENYSGWIVVRVEGSTFDRCNGGAYGAVIHMKSGYLKMTGISILNSRGTGQLVSSERSQPTLVRADQVSMNHSVIANVDSRLAVVTSYWGAVFDTNYLFNLDGSKPAIFSQSAVNRNPVGTNLGNATEYFGIPIKFSGCPGTCGKDERCTNVYNPIDHQVQGFFCF